MASIPDKIPPPYYLPPPKIFRPRKGTKRVIPLPTLEDVLRYSRNDATSKKETM